MGGMDHRHDGAVSNLRFESGGRSDAIVSHYVLLFDLHYLFRNDDWRVDSEPGGGDSGDPAGRIFDFVSVVGLHISGHQHSPAAAIFVVHRAHALLPRGHS